MAMPPERIELAALLRELKGRSRLSYQDLAVKTHMSRSAVHRYCQGTGALPDAEVVERFGRACGATAPELRELHHRLLAAVTACSPEPGECGELREPGGEVPVTPSPEDHPEPGWSVARRAVTRRLWAHRFTVTWTMVACVTSGTVGAFAFSAPSGGRPAGPAVTGATPSPTPTVPRCAHRPGIAEDRRLNKIWKDGVYLCKNTIGVPLYEEPREGVPIGYLDTSPSWFICWVRGARHVGGNDVWYYTQGDRAAEKWHLQAWGYMPASSMPGGPHPNPVITLRCPKT